MLACASSQSVAISRLRLLLAEKFPSMQLRAGGILPTGLAPLDEAEGGLRRAALTELCAGVGAGALFIHAMARTLGREHCFGALVDAGRSFEPEGRAHERLLVVFCAEAMQGIRAADLLLRDGNLSLLMIDLQGAELRGALRIPANTWHRFQRVVEQGNMALAVFSSRPVVEGASVKITLDWRWNFPALAERRTELLARLSARASSRRHLVLPNGLEQRTA